MNDEEAMEHLAAVEELVRAVADRDRLVIDACLSHTAASTLAVLCAELLHRERANLADAEKVLWQTRGVEPAGLSKARAWEIAQASVERRAA
ncbi:hypothetical protein ICM05_01185 [Leucobacter sp. cx-42]|uniref:hypothetical protein n=1 Tax=unclassified Leucobacter TaxID=2621730 RepID=UPI00165D7BFB|nr:MULTISPECIES: hypothetical protein [unclassified Leucobacter]MBC9953262.1 hypothetical protein [Leucobacter sp. cx-42]